MVARLIEWSPPAPEVLSSNPCLKSFSCLFQLRPEDRGDDVGGQPDPLHQQSSRPLPQQGSLPGQSGLLHGRLGAS